MAKNNNYGDKLNNPIGACGNDITSQRLDSLDHETLMFALQIKAGTFPSLKIQDDVKFTALDLGCGLGIQGIRLASFGWDTLAIDNIPRANTAITKDITKWAPITYLQKNAQSLQKEDLKQFLIVYSQRFLHYLPYNAAKKLLKLLVANSHPSARFFLSVSGINSELGCGYHRSHITKRFATLNTEMQELHGIKANVCLYSEEEVIKLTNDCGLSPVTIFSSPFGNIKGIFYKTTDIQQNYENT